MQVHKPQTNLVFIELWIRFLLVYIEPWIRFLLVCLSLGTQAKKGKAMDNNQDGMWSPSGDEPERTPTSSGRKKYEVMDTAEQLPARVRLLLDMLINFYRNGTFETVVLPIIRLQNPLAIRDIDWLVTNYSLAYPVVYQDPTRNVPAPFNVHASYERHENDWKKRLFDPCARGPRIMFYAGGEQYETTIGQLNFFKWAIEHGVIDWAVQHKDEIRHHHQVTDAARKKLIEEQPNREKKRMRLTHTDKNRCIVYISPVTRETEKQPTAKKLKKPPSRSTYEAHPPQ